MIDESAAEMNTESADVVVSQCSVIASQQQSVIVSDAGTNGNEVISEAREFAQDIAHPVSAGTLELSVVIDDVDSNVCDAESAQHLQHDVVTCLNDSVYHDCISASFAGNLLCYVSRLGFLLLF